MGLAAASEPPQGGRGPRGEAAEQPRTREGVVAAEELLEDLVRVVVKHVAGRPGVLITAL